MQRFWIKTPLAPNQYRWNLPARDHPADCFVGDLEEGGDLQDGQRGGSLVEGIEQAVGSGLPTRQVGLRGGGAQRAGGWRFSDAADRFSARDDSLTQQRARLRRSVVNNLRPGVGEIMNALEIGRLLWDGQHGAPHLLAGADFRLDDFDCQEHAETRLTALARPDLKLVHRPSVGLCNPDPLFSPTYPPTWSVNRQIWLARSWSNSAVGVTVTGMLGHLQASIIASATG